MDPMRYFVGSITLSEVLPKRFEGYQKLRLHLLLMTLWVTVWRELKNRPCDVLNSPVMAVVSLTPDCAFCGNRCVLSKCREVLYVL